MFVSQLARYRQEVMCQGPDFVWPDLVTAVHRSARVLRTNAVSYFSPILLLHPGLDLGFKFRQRVHRKGGMKPPTNYHSSGCLRVCPGFMPEAFTDRRGSRHCLVGIPWVRMLLTDWLDGEEN
ncbi:hypothetical protein ElyMa_000696100 [Elysia marginata]|uniref:Uncharacterized protein n=1 Tax=Elysia marginata TaxID=1093978 RepID=A0AAV4GKE2_9GAST|nr:hypothetical protein ElyMa_000696100 [Elysia marginata]